MHIFFSSLQLIHKRAREAEKTMMNNKRAWKSDIESNGEIDDLAESASAPIALEFQDSSGSPESDCQSMYKAAVDGNVAAAGKLLRRDPSLACNQQITKTGDRALHVAVYKKKTKLVRDLVDYVMNPSELELHDGRGYSACCYAATTGVGEVADILMEKNVNLGTKRNTHGTTPLQLAVFFGNTRLALKFLRSAQLVDLLEQEWFDLLHVAVHSQMYGVALQILEMDGSLAVKKGVDQQTVLHVVAQLDISSGCKSRDYPKMKPDLRKLADKLWAEIQKQLERAEVVELITNPPILHNAAKFGNLELITMIISVYPQLLGRTNSEGRSIFHIAIMYQQKSLLELIKQPENIIGYNAIVEDVNGNNILHLAGKLLPPEGSKIICEPDVQMKRDHAWFKEVKKVVPPFFKEKRNNEGQKPREVFWMEHKSLVEKSVKHMKSTAESGILVATIIMTVVFTAAFTPPGGYHEETGKPLLAALATSNQGKKNWFMSFVIFDVLALLSSTFSILSFWSILASNYEEKQYLRSHKLLRLSLTVLLLALLCAICTFLSAFFLVAWKNEEFVSALMIPTCFLLVGGFSFQFYMLFPKAYLIKLITSGRRDWGR